LSHNKSISEKLSHRHLKSASRCW